MNVLSEQEFAELVSKYQHEMYYIALSILKNETYAQDAVAEAILKAFEAREKLKEKEKFKAWLIRILVNVSCTQMKRNKKIILMDEIEILPRQESKALGLWEEVMKLEYKFRVAIILFYYEDFSTKEIAAILHVPEGTVRSRLTRARNKLRIILERKGEK